MASNDSIRIYLNKKDEADTVLSSSTPEQRYIILMNDNLQGDNRELRAKVAELENRVQELETDVDKYDTSNRYIKGILKNFVEVEKLNKELVVIYNGMNLKLSNSFIDSKKTLNHNINVLELFIVSFMFLLLNFHFITFYTLVENISCIVVIGTTLVLCHVNIHKYYSSFDFCSETDRIKKVNSDIKSITDSQDFLSEHIDNL